MSRIDLVDPNADTPSRALLASVRARLGIVPNMTRAMAASPSLLKAYLGFADALSGGRVDRRTSELIALAVAEANGCDYCLAAHTALGGLLRVGADEISSARAGRHADPRTAAILGFARRVVLARGHVDDADVDALRAAGLADADIADVLGHVALNVFTNYFNTTVRTPIDFPLAAPLAEAA